MTRAEKWSVYFFWKFLFIEFSKTYRCRYFPIARFLKMTDQKNQDQLLILIMGKRNSLVPGATIRPHILKQTCVTFY